MRKRWWERLWRGVSCAIGSRSPNRSRRNLKICLWLHSGLTHSIYSGTSSEVRWEDNIHPLSVENSQPSSWYQYKPWCLIFRENNEINPFSVSFIEKWLHSFSFNYWNWIVHLISWIPIWFNLVFKALVSGFESVMKYKYIYICWSQCNLKRFLPRSAAWIKIVSINTIQDAIGTALAVTTWGTNLMSECLDSIPSCAFHPNFPRDALWENSKWWLRYLGTWLPCGELPGLGLSRALCTFWPWISS